jgi:hypothetical protein
MSPGERPIVQKGARKGPTAPARGWGLGETAGFASLAHRGPIKDEKAHQRGRLRGKNGGAAIRTLDTRFLIATSVFEQYLIGVSLAALTVSALCAPCRE